VTPLRWVPTQEIAWSLSGKSCTRQRVRATANNTNSFPRGSATAAPVDHDFHSWRTNSGAVFLMRLRAGCRALQPRYECPRQAYGEGRRTAPCCSVAPGHAFAPPLTAPAAVRHKAFLLTRGLARCRALIYGSLMAKINEPFGAPHRGEPELGRFPRSSTGSSSCANSWPKACFGSDMCI